MRAYGQLAVKPKEIKKYGLEFTGSSIGVLTFATKDGDFFSIDFNEADLSIGENSVSFRLTDLGASFLEEWEEFGKGMSDMESDSKFFKECAFSSVGVYLESDSYITGKKAEKIIGKLDISLKELVLYMDDCKTVECRVEGVEVVVILD